MNRAAHRPMHSRDQCSRHSGTKPGENIAVHQHVADTIQVYTTQKEKSIGRLRILLASHLGRGHRIARQTSTPPHPRQATEIEKQWHKTPM